MQRVTFDSVFSQTLFSFVTMGIPETKYFRYGSTRKILDSDYTNRESFLPAHSLSLSQTLVCIYLQECSILKLKTYR